MGEGEHIKPATPVTKITGNIRTTLGPFGANKLVVSKGGEVSSTSSGSVVLEKLQLEDPANRLLAAEAEAFQSRNADGTATFVLLAGELLSRATDLREQGLHPTTIERAYDDAAAVAAERISGMARPLSEFGTATVAETAVTSTRNPSIRRQVGEYLSQIVDRMSDEQGTFDSRNVHVISRIGGASQATNLVHGLVLDNNPVHEAMPRTATDTGVALLSSAVDFRRIGSPSERTSDIRVSLEIDSFEDRAAVRDWEREKFEGALQTARDLGCQFLATDDALAERVQTRVADSGILALQRVGRDEFRMLARATGATIVSDLDRLSGEALGRADVSVRRIAGRDMTRIESRGENPVYTVFVRASDPRSVNEFERSVKSALTAVEFAQRTDTVVPGGGATELAAANAVRDAARSVAGREQLAMEAFADALLVVPRVLAENGGVDVSSAVSRLRVAHDDGNESVGIDSISGAVTDAFADDPIVEPPSLKRNIVTSATELSVKLVRIDERLPATDLGEDDDGFATGHPEPDQTERE
jgi:chaperonin GroEL (HSP60 family)